MQETLDLGSSTPQPAGETYSIYADESKPNSTSPWLIITVLVLPDSRRASALRNLRAARDRYSYGDEVHFVDIRNRSLSPHGSKTKVACDWAAQIVHDETKTWNMHVVAIKSRILDHKRFGSKPDDNIYARFFRSALKIGIKQSITHTPRRISRIFHDASSLAHHEYFPWHSIQRLAVEDGVKFSRQEIEFISSDHQIEGHPEPWAAELIQAVDVWTGVFRQVLTMSSKNSGQLEVVSIGADLIRILNDRNHICRRLRGGACVYQHRGRCSVNFFPNDRIRRSNFPEITGPEALNYFYRGESLAYFNHGQTTLFGD